MIRCVQLAKLGAGNVAPNPMVGAVLVYHDRIIGEGYHEQYGLAHAEVNCIKSVTQSDQELIPESTLYVSLEPCAHFGKTPPCADLIIAQQIKKVVIGCEDPFVAVHGKGIAKLKAAGIEVIENILRDECRDLNKRFFIFHTEQRPYFILKWAQSNDGFISCKNSSIKISNEFSDRLVHKWRSEEAAIMIGTNTALVDDPFLTTRLWKGNNPVRIVVDMKLRLPASLHIFSDGNNTIVLNKIKEEKNAAVIYTKIKEDDLVQEICNALYKAGLQSVLIEGGSRLLQSFIDAGIWDESIIIKNEVLRIKNGTKAPELKNAFLIHEQKTFSDQISFYKKNGSYIK